MRGRTWRRALIPLAVVAAVALSGCAGAADAAPVPSASPTLVAPYGDGTLTVAVLVAKDDPARSDVQSAGAQIAGAEAAARAVRSAADGGVTGVVPLRVLHRTLPLPGDGSVSATLDDLAARATDVILVPADAASRSELVVAAAERRIGVLTPSEGAAVTEAELAAVRLEDPAVGDPGAGVAVYRAAVAAALAAVAGADDGGLSVVAALPRVLEGRSECANVTPCVDALVHGHDVTYLPMSGLTLAPEA